MKSPTFLLIRVLEALMFYGFVIVTSLRLVNIRIWETSNESSFCIETELP